MATDNRVFVIGVGMTKFERCDKDARELGQAAAKDALKDAAIDYDKIEQGFCGYINGMSTLGQQTLYGVGMTGIPVYNVNNNCSTGSTALFMAYNAIKLRPERGRPRARLREDAEGPARESAPRPREAEGGDREGEEAADRGAHVRRRRTRSHGEVRHQAGRPSPRSP